MAETAMSMELEAEDGATRIPISPGSQKKEVGRRTGLATSDRTISRRHVSFQLAAHSSPVRPEGEPSLEADVETDAGRVSFEVIGRNPVLVVTRAGEKQIFRRSERGELVAGDRISLSLKSPCFLSVKSNAGDGAVDNGVLDAVQRRKQRTLQRRKEREEAQGKETKRADVSRVNVEGEGGGAGQESKLLMPDHSEIDPVKEFGFLVRGHEFDHYRRKLRDIKHWNWFLNEQVDSTDEDEHPDEVATARRKSRRKAKRKKGDDEGDEDWTGESEDEKAVAVGAATAGRPKYRTRSKDQKRQKPGPPGEEAVQRKGYSGRNRRSEVEDEEDETLGGFIVETGEGEEEQQEMEEEEEEEEMEDEEDEDDD